MKKICFIISIVLIFLPGCPGAFQLSATTEGGKVTVCSQYRDISPGEVVKISLQSPRFSSAVAHFHGKDYMFVPDSSNSSFFLLIGLGLDMKPGIYELAIHINFPDGSRKEFPLVLPVSSRKFAVQNINVDEKYVFPSAKAQERIKKEFELVKEVYQAYAPGWLGHGNFIVPSNGKIRKNFGEKRIFNNEFHSRHRGVDIRSSRGTKVKAANSGKIVLKRNLYYGGNTVIIDHGAGLFSIYCHLSRVSAKKGDLVNKGEVIGRVGSTGRVTGPHLHWGVKLYDQFVSPFSILQISFD